MQKMEYTAMTLDEKIHQYAQKLPLSFQEELFDFVQYLLMKAEQQEKQEWASLSLSSAMRELEDEPVLYSLSDLKVIFAWSNQGKFSLVQLDKSPVTDWLASKAIYQIGFLKNRIRGICGKHFR